MIINVPVTFYHYAVRLKVIRKNTSVIRRLWDVKILIFSKIGLAVKSLKTSDLYIIL